ncbi:hypothetical protein D3C72_682120 [compost metagenome]
MQLAQAFHGDGDQNHRCAEQYEAQAVETGALGTAQVRDEFPHGVASHQPHRQVDQEDPVPGQVLHHPAAHGRTDQGAEQPGNGDEAHDPHQFRTRVGAQHHQPPDRQHQRPAQALDHPGADQQAQAARQCAEQRAETEQQDCTEEDLPGAKTIGDPARSGNQQGDREHVGNDHPLHAQWVFGQVAGHGRQGGVEDRPVEGLHEEGNGDDPGYPAGGDSVERRAVGHGTSCQCELYSVPVGASLLAMNVKAMHFSRQHASSFTTIASKLAPTGACVFTVSTLVG